MVVFSSGLIGEVDGAAASELGVGDGLLDSKLFDGADDRKYENAEPVVVFIVEYAIDQEIVLFQTCSIHSDTGHTALVPLRTSEPAF